MMWVLSFFIPNANKCTINKTKVPQASGFEPFSSLSTAICTTYLGVTQHQELRMNFLKRKLKMVRCMCMVSFSVGKSRFLVPSYMLAPPPVSAAVAVGAPACSPPSLPRTPPLLPRRCRQPRTPAAHRRRSMEDMLLFPPEPTTTSLKHKLCLVPMGCFASIASQGRRSD